MSDRGLIIYVRSSSRRSCSIVMHPSRGTMIIREGCTRIRERNTHHPLTSHMIILVGRPLATRAGVHDRSARTQEVAYIGTHSAPQDPSANGDARDTQGPAHKYKHTNTSTCNRSCCSSRAFAPCPLLLLAASMCLLRRRRQRQLATAAELQQLVSRYPVTAAQRS